MADSVPMATESTTSSPSPPSTATNQATLNPEIERLQTRLASHPQDFDSWCALVSQSEATKDSQLIRNALNGLLQQFPLCYGYWQRLAKHESSASAGASSSTTPPPADVATLERGLSLIPQCHELWTFYASEAMKNEAMQPEEVRSIFVRGAAAIGTDSGASLFWDKYLEFELQQFSTPSVQAQLQLLPPPYTGTLIGAVYAQVLGLPLRDIEKFWTGFSQHFAVNYPLNYLASPKEAEEFTAAYPKSIPSDRSSFVGPDGSTQPMTLTAYLNEWEVEQRRLLLVKREQTFRASQMLRDEKYPHEHVISRSYFHVAPLPPTDVQAWNGLLDLLESKLMRTLASQSTAAATTPSSTASALTVNPVVPTMENLDPLLLRDTLTTYEKCLIPCAGVADLWDRYANFLVGLNELDRSMDVRKRQLVFMQRNELSGVAGASHAIQDVCLAIAELAERQGSIESAREWMNRAMVTVTPSAATTAAATANGAAKPPADGTPYLEAVLAQIAFERRIYLSENPGTRYFEPTSPINKLYTDALAKLTGPANARAFVHLALHHIHFTLTQVEFSREDDRLQAVRHLYQTASEVMFPSPISETTTTPSAAATATDAAPPSASPTTTTVTTVPRLVASKQFLVFWLSWIDFETNVARADVQRIADVFEQALNKRPSTYDEAQVLAANPHLVHQRGASGLSEASRRQLWLAYVHMMEERSIDLKQIEQIRQQYARQVAMVSSVGVPSSSPMVPPPMISHLGKRKAASLQVTPAAVPPAKVHRPMPPARGYGPPASYGGAPAYGQAGYAAQAATGADYYSSYGQYGQQYGQYPPQQ